MIKKELELESNAKDIFYKKVLIQYQEYLEMKKAYEKLTGTPFELPPDSAAIEIDPEYNNGWTWRDKILFLLKTKGDLTANEIIEIAAKWEGRTKGDIKNSVQSNLYVLVQQNKVIKKGDYNSKYKINDVKPEKNKKP
ncbi:MAG: hypothetical protein K0S53_657 [Bacteroidetes bacterium]|jgi:hypothetical protein|nr:hypothetical protein [Bacteroidota bacterium]